MWYCTPHLSWLIVWLSSTLDLCASAIQTCIRPELYGMSSQHITKTMWEEEIGLEYHKNTFPSLSSICFLGYVCSSRKRKLNQINHGCRPLERTDCKSNRDHWKSDSVPKPKLATLSELESFRLRNKRVPLCYAGGYKFLGIREKHFRNDKTCTNRNAYLDLVLFILVSVECHTAFIKVIRLTCDKTTCTSLQILSLATR